MPESIDEFIKDIPPIIELPVEMDKANQIIEIYSGSFLLKNEKTKMLIDGKIEYHWFPQKGAIFTGSIISENESSFMSEDALDDYDLIIDDLVVGKCFIINRRISSSSDKAQIKGVFTKYAVIQDSSISVDSVTFAIPNLKSFIGVTVHKKFENSVSRSNSRLQFENKEYKVIIDKTIDYKNRLESLNSNGGYLLLYSGIISKKNGSISLEKARVFFYCFDTFITFLNGRRISTTFHNGIFENNKVWSDFSNYSIDIHKTANSWTLAHSINGLNELFQNFSSLWTDENDRNFLISAVHWYIEANNNSGYTEGSIIMAQTALELIYNWLLIEKNGLLVGRDSENINAANKIRLLLSHLKIDNNVPEAFNELQELVDSSTEYVDAPDVVVQIRNAIIHSQIEKRKKISALPFQTKYQALQLCIWYIEMSLLFILKYKGKYTNRCSKELYPGDREINVPWI
jgi:hypothetical protein